jgi:hypothetical protein
MEIQKAPGTMRGENCGTFYTSIFENELVVTLEDGQPGSIHFNCVDNPI